MSHHTSHESLPPFDKPAQMKMFGMSSMYPARLYIVSQSRLLITGTETCCMVSGSGPSERRRNASTKITLRSKLNITLWKLTFIKSTPAGYGCPFTNESIIRTWQTNRYYILSIMYGLVKAQQSQVILESARIKLGVRRDDLNASFNVRQCFVFMAHIIFTET